MLRRAARLLVGLSFGLSLDNFAQISSASSAAANSASSAGSVTSASATNEAHILDDDVPQFDVFKTLLLEYKKNPDCFEKLDKGQKTYDDIDHRYLTKLAPKVINARFKEYNVPYKLNLRIERKLSRDIKTLKSRLDNTPITDYGKREQMELNYVAAVAQVKKAKSNLCLLSVQANTSILNAVETLRPEDKKIAETTSSPVRTPKMPFRVLGSRAERLAKSDNEKPNLTPVDDEFYKTQLGKKLELDLGGRADYWSYDFDKDELYVKVKDEIGKVMVVNQGAGVRFIRTRVGGDFVEPRGTDTRVDLTTAKGKFLTGDTSDATLFGVFPKDPDRVRDTFPSSTSHSSAKPFNVEDEDHR